MRSTFKILFYLNTSKRKKSGMCPVMGRITVDGGIAQFSLKEDVHPRFWDAKNGRAKGKSREHIELNRKIDKSELSIRKIYSRTVETTGYVTAEQIKNEITGVTTKTETLLELFKEHNLEYKERVGIDRTESSYNNYKYSYQYLSEFIRLKYEQSDFALYQLDMSFINDYVYYLRVDAGLKPNSMLLNIIILMKLVKRAINQGTILHDPFPDFDKSKYEWKYQHVSGDELERLLSARIQSKSVCFVRDMFVFSCFTGLAYSDICQLTEKHLRKAFDESIWIDIQRQKTGVECNIRLLDIPVVIIEKYRPYRKNEYLFHMISKSNISSNLRKIEKICNIKHLHFHMARHTFATQVCLTNGVSMEAVSKMMGHNSMRSTQMYGEIENLKVGRDMKKLAKRTEGKYVIS